LKKYLRQDILLQTNNKL